MLSNKISNLFLQSLYSFLVSSELFVFKEGSFINHDGGGGESGV